MGSSSALGTGAVSVNGTLDLGGQSYTALFRPQDVRHFPYYQFRGTSSLIINNSAANILDGDVREDGGVVSLVKSGAGSLNITGNNTYTGGTTLNAGTLNIGHASALGSGPLTIGGTATIDNTSGSALSLRRYLQTDLGRQFTFKGSNSLNLGTGPSLYRHSDGDRCAKTLTVAPFSAWGVAGLTKAGAGTLLLLVITPTREPRPLPRVCSNSAMGGRPVRSPALPSSITDVLSLIAQARLLSEPTSWNRQSGEGRQWHASAHRENHLHRRHHRPKRDARSGKLIRPGDRACLRQWRARSRGQSYTALSGLRTYANSHVTGSSGTSSLIINNSAANILDGDVREDGGVVSLVKSGVGSLNLTGNNTYTGGTTLNAGLLNIGHASALGSGPLTIGGISTFDNVSGSALLLPYFQADLERRFHLKGPIASISGRGR